MHITIAWLKNFLVEKEGLIDDAALRNLIRNNIDLGLLQESVEICDIHHSSMVNSNRRKEEHAIFKNVLIEPLRMKVNSLKKVN